MDRRSETTTNRLHPPCSTSRRTRSPCDAERGEGWRFLRGIVGFDSPNRGAVGITSGELTARPLSPLRLPEYLPQAPGGADANLRGVHLGHREIDPHATPLRPRKENRRATFT